MFNGTDTSGTSSESSLGTILGGVGVTFGGIITFGLALKCLCKKYTSKSQKTEKNKIKLSPTGEVEFIENEVITNNDSSSTEAGGNAGLSIKARINYNRNSNNDSESKGESNGEPANFSQQLVSLVLKHKNEASPSQKSPKYDDENPDPIASSAIALCKEISKFEDPAETIAQATLMLKSMKKADPQAITYALTVLNQITIDNSKSPSLTTKNYKDDSAKFVNPYHNKSSPHHRRSQSDDFSLGRKHHKFLKSKPLSSVLEPPASAASEIQSEQNLIKPSKTTVELELIKSSSNPASPNDSKDKVDDSIKLLALLASQASSEVGSPSAQHDVGDVVPGIEMNILG